MGCDKRKDMRWRGDMAWVTSYLDAEFFLNFKINRYLYKLYRHYLIGSILCTLIFKGMVAIVTSSN